MKKHRTQSRKLDLLDTTIYIFTSIALVISIFTLTKFLRVLNTFYGYSLEIKPDMAVTGQVGDFIGGVIGTLLTFSSLLLLLITLRSQRKFFERERFENRYFEMLRVHREYIDHIEINRIVLFKDNDVLLIKGRKVFTEFNTAYLSIFTIGKSYCEANKIEIDYKKDFPNVIYLILFFGYDFILNQQIVDNYTEKFEKKYPDLIKKIVEKLKAYKTGDDTTVSLNGVHEQFGNYFRHLFQTAKYVHESTFLNTEEKKGYLKMLRTQMGDYEQAVFFYNSLSDLGSDWELTNPDGYKLISDYQIIKNIPLGTTLSINPKDYYPEAFV